MGPLCASAFVDLWHQACISVKYTAKNTLVLWSTFNPLRMLFSGAERKLEYFGYPHSVCKGDEEQVHK